MVEIVKDGSPEAPPVTNILPSTLKVHYAQKTSLTLLQPLVLLEGITGLDLFVWNLESLPAWLATILMLGTGHYLCPGGGLKSE